MTRKIRNEERAWLLRIDQIRIHSESEISVDLTWEHGRESRGAEKPASLKWSAWESDSFTHQLPSLTSVATELAIRRRCLWMNGELEPILTDPDGDLAVHCVDVFASEDLAVRV